MTPFSLRDGRVLDLEVTGPEDGPVLVFFHGTPGCRLQVPELASAARANGLRLVTWSRPGYAGSTRQPGRSVADVATDTAAVLDHLGAEECVVAGWSGGGPHSLACAALLPDRVRGALVLAGVAPYGADGLDWMAGMGEDNVAEFGAALEGEDRLRPWLEQWQPELVTVTGEQVAEQLRTLLPPVDVDILTGGVAEVMADQFRTGLAPGVDGWLDDDLTFAHGWGFDLASIRVPVLLWQGTEDLMVPFAHGAWLAEHVPGVDARLEEGQGHLSIGIGAMEESVAWLRGLL